MKASPRLKTAGFTIIETLIVLAITGALFLAAVLLINGKQRQTSFNQSIRDIQSQLQQTANEVGSGNYPNDGTISCSVVGGKPQPGKAGTNSQGTNTPCIFLGKMLQFGVKDTDPEEYYVYTIVGLRSGTSSTSINLSGSKARLIAQGTGDPTTIPDAYQTKRLLYGLSVSRKYYQTNPGKAVYFGLTSGVLPLGSTDTSQQANVVTVAETAADHGLDLDKTTAVKRINDGLGAANVNPTSGVQMCFNSGGTQQSGLITIGGSGRLSSAIDLKIYENRDCV